MTSHDASSQKCKPCSRSFVACLLASVAAATLVFVVVSVCRAAASAAAAAARHALCLFFFFLSCTTLSSDCRAAASAAAAAARHAGCVCSSFFFVLHNADVSSTDFFSRIWAEPANITHLEWCLRGDRCVHGARVTRA